MNSSAEYTTAPAAVQTKKPRLTTNIGKPEKSMNEVSVEEKRRQERNLREQQRSHKISQQVKELRAILTESNIPFKPTKFSILASVVEYIKQLQSHAMFLDAEHQKLVNTINQTSEMLATGQTPEMSVPSDSRVAALGNDADMLFVQDIDYRGIFNQCSAALGVAALDGRFIDCNAEFELVSGYKKCDLVQLSLFNLLTNSDMEEVFKVMGDMLKEKSNTDDTIDSGNAGGSEPEATFLRTYWSGVVFTPDKTMNTRVLMNITLARSSDGMPKFFNCSLTPA